MGLQDGILNVLGRVRWTEVICFDTWCVTMLTSPTVGPLHTRLYENTVHNSPSPVSITNNFWCPVLGHTCGPCLINIYGPHLGQPGQPQKQPPSYGLSADPAVQLSCKPSQYTVLTARKSTPWSASKVTAFTEKLWTSLPSHSYDPDEKQWIPHLEQK